MFFSEALNTIPGLRYVFESMSIDSALSRRTMLSQEMVCGAGKLSERFDRLNTLREEIISSDACVKAHGIRRILAGVKDIRNTATRVRSGNILDDVELFEIKAFALQYGKFVAETKTFSVLCSDSVDLEPVLRELDPKNDRIPHFAVYDYFSDDLAAARAKLKSSETRADNLQTEQIYARIEELEDSVRKKLSTGIAPFAENIKKALEHCAAADIMLSTVLLTVEKEFTIPVINDLITCYKGIFNPTVKASLEVKGENFQPVDIEFGPYPTVITGANMGGKTVLLQTLALSQALFQFGLSVPAARANIKPVDQIFLSVGDGQDSSCGLSSFASEIIGLDKMAGYVREGVTILALIDEPARSTNPTEGGAIVKGLIKYLNDHEIYSVITTHYNIGIDNGKILRVKGFISDRIDDVSSIQRQMDYSLAESHCGEAPREAVRIAGLLGLDKEIMQNIEDELDGVS